jgi:hypothetical protein
VIPGFRSSILSEDFIQRGLHQTRQRFDDRARHTAHRQLLAWWARVTRSIGPASSLRTILDQSALPLLGRLGFCLVREPARIVGDLLLARLEAPRGSCGLVVAPFQHELASVWRDAVRFGIHLEARWCFCTNGVQLYMVDARHTYARRFIAFDLEGALADDRTFALLWTLCRAEALAGLDSIIARSDRHGAHISASLHLGVHDALIEIGSGLASARQRLDLSAVFDQSLTILYRILFLLFAEARGLVPMWHPVYRDSYSIESLRDAIEIPGRPRGLWETLQAIARLAHAGCDADDLKVTPFNGALFAPGRAPLAETATIADEGMRRALVSLTTRQSPSGRERIAYSDLGVEQLGSVYETVLDYVPQASARRITFVKGTGRRKATGTFYTPRSITDFLVRRTLHPLCEDRSAEQILNLRVLDPAMGSGAFLVAACRHLAGAYEHALVRDGVCTASDISEPDRAGFRRLVAQRCLYGVDLNPMAVQLARLSLWLATLAADAPLSFLDHHLRPGNSLLGASIGDLVNRPNPGGRGSAASRGTLPLFDDDGWGQTMRGAVPLRLSLSLRPDDSVAIVRDKERVLADVAAADSPLGRWKTVADVWCACWMWSAGSSAPPRAAFSALADAVLRGQSALRPREAARRVDDARALAAERGLFHWPLEFPEAFFDARGDLLPDGGFHAVIGNPPWEMLRADQGDESERHDARTRAAAAMHFIRRSGVYALVRDGHANCYQLFLERALQLAAPRGRIGLVLPAGLAIDHGSAALRQTLLNRTDIDTLIGFDNQRAIFPIHRSVRFLLVTTTTGSSTSVVRARFGVNDPGWLDAVPDSSSAGRDLYPVVITPALLRRWSGDASIIPELRNPIDVQIFEKIAARVPPLGGPEGWHAHFGRELNATDDRGDLIAAGHGLPVLEGKHLEPFRVHVEDARLAIRASDAARLLNGPRTFGRPRLAYRDIASATNRLTLIAAIVPRHVVTTHTLFCLKTMLTADEQWFLCGVLNSFVANYLVRPQVSTHVSAAIVERLPVPRPARDSEPFRTIVSLATRLATAFADDAAYAALQAHVAGLYDLTVEEFAHVVSTFPLVEEGVKEATLRTYVRGHRGTETQDRSSTSLPRKARPSA